MKSYSILLGLVLMANITSAQGSLLGDLMDVAPVAAAETSNFKEALEDYNLIFEKRKAELEEDLNKLSEAYKKDVTDVITRFSKVLAKGVETDVKNEKTRVVISVNSLTIRLRKSKQMAVTQFGNLIAPEIRKLHIDLRQDKQTEIREMSKEYHFKFDEEYTANQAVIEQFKSTQHLTKAEPAGI